MRTRMTIQDLRVLGSENGLRVWIANGTGGRGNPGYMGDVTIARLKMGSPNFTRAIDARRAGAIEDERSLTAWHGLISACNKAKKYVQELVN